MAYEKSFDDILAGILTDFRNVFPSVDCSQGSLAYMKAAGYASALWGLYRYQEWISRQIFPDTADSEALEHHAWVRGLTRTAGETDAEYLARLLEHIRQPPAGGNAHDYEMWAKEIDGVAAAYAIPLAQGAESVDVIVFSDVGETGSEIPSAELLAEVAVHIETLRPVGARFVRVLSPVVRVQDVTITGVGSSRAAEIQVAIEAYIQSFYTGQALYLPKLASIVVNSGVENPVIALPTTGVVPTPWEVLRPGEVNVS